MDAPAILHKLTPLSPPLHSPSPSPSPSLPSLPLPAPPCPPPWICSAMFFGVWFTCNMDYCSWFVVCVLAIWRTDSASVGNRTAFHGLLLSGCQVTDMYFVISTFEAQLTQGSSFWFSVTHLPGVHTATLKTMWVCRFC